MKIHTTIQYLVGLGAAALLAACATNPPCPVAAPPPFPPPPPPHCGHPGWPEGPGHGMPAGQWPPGNMPGPGEQQGGPQGGQFGPAMRPWQGGGGPSMTPPGAPPPPPAEVFEACTGKKSGDACVAKKDGWELKGNCSAPPDTEAKLACAPPQPKGQAPAAGQKSAAPAVKPAAK